jgi:hypothetical protein
LGRVLQGEAAAGSTAGPAPAAPGPAVPSAAPTVDPLGSIQAKLQDPDFAKRAYAIAEVRRLNEGASALQPDLIAVTGDPSVVVRAAALSSLPAIGGDKGIALAAVRAALRHPDPYTQVRAAQALAALGEPSAAVVYLIAFPKGDSA